MRFHECSLSHRFPWTGWFKEECNTSILGVVLAVGTPRNEIAHTRPSSMAVGAHEDSTKALGQQVVGQEEHEG